MISLDPMWEGLDYALDTPPYDGMAIVFLPDIVSDALGSQLQLESRASAQSFTEAQFRAATENMYDSGLIVSASI